MLCKRGSLNVRWLAAPLGGEERTDADEATDQDTDLALCRCRTVLIFIKCSCVTDLAFRSHDDGIELGLPRTRAVG
jgi:hypothetical protein